MASPTRWGFLGASKIANDFVIATRTLPKQDHRLVAVAARDLGRAKEFASKNGVERAYGSYKELVLDGDVEIVYVSTINVSHKELCLLALNHGKHVLCEKPLGINQKEANEVSALAKEKGLFCMEGNWTLFFPLHLDLQEQLKSKDSIVGDVKLVSASFGRHDVRQSLPYLLVLEYGGGAILTFGFYCLTLIDMVYDGEMPLSITASGVKTETGVDETVCVNMTYSGNRMGQVVTSIGAWFTNDASIAGSKGNITVAGPFWCPERCTASDGAVKEYPLPKPDKPLNFINSTGLRYEIQAVRDSLLAGETESSVVPHSTTLRILGFIDEIRRQIGVVFPQDNVE